MAKSPVGVLKRRMPLGFIRKRQSIITKTMKMHTGTTQANQ